MYDKKRINELAYRYIETDDDKIFEELIEELVNLVRPLVRKYDKYKEYWDDLEQEIFIKLWEQRKSLKNSSTHQPFQHFYRRITRYMVYFTKDFHRFFDSANPYCVSIKSIFHEIEDEWD